MAICVTLLRLFESLESIGSLLVVARVLRVITPESATFRVAERRPDGTATAPTVPAIGATPGGAAGSIGAIRPRRGRAGRTDPAATPGAGPCRCACVADRRRDGRLGAPCRTRDARARRS